MILIPRLAAAAVIVRVIIITLVIIIHSILLRRPLQKADFRHLKTTLFYYTDWIFINQYKKKENFCKV
jgi:hypothetical protein